MRGSCKAHIFYLVWHKRQPDRNLSIVFDFLLIHFPTASMESSFYIKSTIQCFLLSLIDHYFEILPRACHLFMRPIHIPRGNHILASKMMNAEAPYSTSFPSKPNFTKYSIPTIYTQKEYLTIPAMFQVIFLGAVWPMFEVLRVRAIACFPA